MNTVLSGPAVVPYAVGWALLIAGSVFSWVLGQQKWIGGEPSSPYRPLALLLVGSALLATFVPLSSAVWWGTSEISDGILEEAKWITLRDDFTRFGERLKQYWWSPGPGGVLFWANLKDNFVAFSASVSLGLAMLAREQLEYLQVVLFNVIFTFGPMMIGLSAFGLPTARIWMVALLEISSWSITSAVLYSAITARMRQYMELTATQGVLDTEFLSIVSICVFMSSMTFVVPVVTGRLLGISALGELANATAGNDMTKRLANFLQSTVNSSSNPISPTGPSMQPTDLKGTAPTTRPGD
ncbi:hypothetical protein HUA74_43975 [Myxococcus sp. CA051A]|uniref:hypothetical protein n=1 Tax=Myxococcus sp. CA051A TaxID=2741739 RepID=UPI00157AC1E4|nr:hypothetical protein [Myxococcus sp. CA051A]NTX67628.1 hypothetical protein [Myxococcus sp. CA051A]